MRSSVLQTLAPRFRAHGYELVNPRTGPHGDRAPATSVPVELVADTARAMDLGLVVLGPGPGPAVPGPPGDARGDDGGGSGAERDEATEAGAGLRGIRGWLRPAPGGCHKFVADDRPDAHETELPHVRALRHAEHRADFAARMFWDTDDEMRTLEGLCADVSRGLLHMTLTNGRVRTEDTETVRECALQMADAVALAARTYKFRAHSVRLQAREPESS